MKFDIKLKFVIVWNLDAF